MAAEVQGRQPRDHCGVGEEDKDARQVPLRGARARGKGGDPGKDKASPPQAQAPHTPHPRADRRHDKGGWQDEDQGPNSGARRGRPKDRGTPQAPDTKRNLRRERSQNHGREQQNPAQTSKNNQVRRRTQNLDPKPPPHGDPNAWLFPKTTRPHEPMNRQTAANNIKRVARKAGIKTNVHPHLLRHSQATFLAKHLSTMELMTYFGWKNVKTAQRYVHLSMRDTEEALLTKVYGIHPETKPPVKTKDCPRCATQNPAQAKFCWNYGYPFEEARIELIRDEQRIEKS